MENHGENSQSVTIGQIQKFTGMVFENLPLNLLTKDTIQALIENPPEIKRVLNAFIPQPLDSNKCEDLVADWQKFYQDYLDLTVDLSAVKIPGYQKDFDRVIIIPQGLTLEGVIGAIVRKMKLCTWKNDNRLLNKDVPTNDRDAKNGAYAIRIRERAEADEEMKNKSADYLAKKQIAGITLIERLVYELKYFSETKSHLDIQNWTLCSGSRRSDGDVPRIGWYSGSGSLGVGHYNPDGFDDGLRARVVVSC